MRPADPSTVAEPGWRGRRAAYCGTEQSGVPREQRRPSIAPADLAFMVDGTSEIYAHTGDPDHHRPNAIDRLAEADAGAAVAQSSGRTSTPNAAPFHMRCRARARRAVPPRHRSSA